MTTRLLEMDTAIEPRVVLYALYDRSHVGLPKKMYNCMSRSLSAGSSSHIVTAQKCTWIEKDVLMI